MEKGRGKDSSSSRPSSFNHECLVRLRKLPKSKLAGVIFGCTHQTMSECLQKQLFGLPGLHSYYVQNIKPGMPLFLFNYSDRKLHGLYEAASRGQNNIDPHAWTNDRNETTKFPAQVRVCTKMCCKPIKEKDYKHIIKDNYYTKSHFFFELDHIQVECLLSLFSHSFQRGTVGSPCHASNEGDSGKSLGTGETYSCGNFKQYGDGNPPANPRTSQSASEGQIESVTECEELVQNDDISPSEQAQLDCPWNREEMASDEDEIILLKGAVGSGKNLLSDSDEENSISVDNHLKKLSQLTVSVKNLIIRTETLELKQIWLENELEYAKRMKEESDAKYQQICNHVHQLKEKMFLNVDDDKLSYSSPNTVLKSERMIFLIGGSDGDSMLNALHSYSLSSDVLTELAPMNEVRSHFTSLALNHDIYVFGGFTNGSFLDTVELYNIVKREWILLPPLSRRKGCLTGATLNGQIFAIGGGNEQDCFSEVELFDASTGKWTRNQPMLEKRFGPAASVWNGAIITAGGNNGQSYLTSVEWFDPREGSWSYLPSMNHARISHSLVTFNDKIYAIGGHDGKKTLFSTEAFDPRMDSWLLSEPLNIDRGYASCLVLGDSVLAIGGVNGKENFVDTVESYREGTGWTATDLKGIGKRAYFSAVVV